MVSTSLSGIAEANRIPLYSVTGKGPTFTTCNMTSLSLLRTLRERATQTLAGVVFQWFH